MSAMNSSSAMEATPTVAELRSRWAKETRMAIEFEEDPHKAALNDNPELVYVGTRTWAAIFVSHAFSYITT